MFISYESDEIRECCLLLSNSNIYSRFTIDEIKVIRSIIADLKAAPKLSDSPVTYKFDKDLGIVDIEYGVFKIVCKAITSLPDQTHDKIQRIKILKIVNVQLEEDLVRKDNNN
ncbi:MAG TPA: hypothetical protein PLP23_11245 [Panacibacter sp.]|nr:hypothetical protein [Panacibacter sp.]